MLIHPAWADHAPPAVLAPNYQHYLERGRQAKLSDQEIRALLADFESALAEAYGTLGRQIGPALDKDAPTDSDRELIVASTGQAGEKISAATRTFLAPFGLSDGEMTELVPKYWYLSRFRKLMVSILTPPRPMEMVDEVSMYESVPFGYFMAGVSRRVGVYMGSAADSRNVGKEMRVNFPMFYFNSNGIDRELPMREDVVRFLANPSMRDVTGKLHDAKITAFRETILQSSRRYDLDGVTPYYRTYGENDHWDEQGRILIYDANILHRAVRWPAGWTKAYRNAIEIHELMHTLHHRQRSACGAASALKAQALDEAQAQLSTLALLATERDPELPLILSLNLSLVGRAEQELVGDGFYTPLIHKILRRTAPNAAPADTAGWDGPAKIAVLADATAEDVAQQAHAALVEVAEREAIICP
ncbi:hypothetical protein D0T23_07145 [Duganella sp. BJB475]|nr:hypothetical protein D0T23_07145 [Duganella sp. BJB475]RFP36116.1 hypothetical protein D0T21_06690 [Duganella sp. BJB476]